MAATSLLALILAIIVSCISPINVGFLSIALAFLVGRFVADLNVSSIIAGFPAGLFLTLAGVTLLFSQAKANGTLDKIAYHSMRLARGNRGMIPVIFFLMAAGLASIGAGNIAATALLAPIAMSIAAEVGISAFLMVVMLANGANAGAFSPFAPTGIIAVNIMSSVGLEGTGWANYFNTLAAQSFVAFGGYFLLGGTKLFRNDAEHHGQKKFAHILAQPIPPFTPKQRLTLAVIASLVVSVIGAQLLSFAFGDPSIQLDIGLAAFLCAVILSLFRAADEETAVRSMPWSVIMMVSGVTVLMSVLDRTGGMDLFTSLLARLSGPGYVNGMIALVTGMISAYSSSSGVVLPAFLPTIPGLVSHLGGGNPLMIAYSINVGSHLVDVSPLSTLGALCIASAAPAENRMLLFRKLMIWGLSMAAVGAVVCQLFFGYR
jgi:di/tricarboxylate transporter